MKIIDNVFEKNDEGGLFPLTSPNVCPADLTVNVAPELEQASHVVVLLAALQEVEARGAGQQEQAVRQQQQAPVARPHPTQAYVQL